MKTEITKTVRLDLDLNKKIAALAESAGTDHSSIMRMAIKVGLPIVERHFETLFNPTNNYPIEEIPGLRAAEIPRKSHRRSS